MEISPELVSKISEKILPYITAWQNRPLEETYPFVFMDAIHYKVREERTVVTKTAYPRADIQRCIIHQICSSTNT